MVFEWSQLSRRKEGVILAEETEVRTGPTPEQTVSFRLHQGTEVDILEGGHALLDRCRPALIVESGLFEGRMADVLRPLGYQPFVFVRGALEPGDRGGLNTFFIAR